MKPLFRKISLPVDQSPTAIAFHPHSQSIFVGDHSGNIDLFDLVNGHRIHRLSKFASPILAIGFDEDSIYTFNQENGITRWDLKTFSFKEHHSITRGEGITTHAQFDPQGSHLIYGREMQGFSWPYSALFLVDLQNYRVVKEYDFGRRDLVNMDKIAISRDGAYLCASGLDVYITSDGDWGFDSPEFIAQWNLKDCQLVCSYECDTAGRPSDHEGFAQTFSPDSKQLLVSLNGELALWKVSQGIVEDAEERLDFADIDEVEWSPVSDLVSFGKADGTVLFFDMKLRKIIFEEKLFKTPVSCIHFSSDGSFLGALSEDLKVEVYEIFKKK